MNKFSELAGQTLKSVEVNEDRDKILFVTTAGRQYRMFHFQDCCEQVSIEDICGDLSDLVGVPILKAEETSSDSADTYLPTPEYTDETSTWTFYNMATIKGYVTIRWFGTSNGYYSESVNFEEVE